jgi:hypothetical protein
VNAETRDVLLDGLKRVAEGLGVADPEGDSLESARRLRAYLQTRAGEGLPVLDDATDPDGLRPFLPATGGTQVVVTTTDRAFAALGQPVDVSAFTRPQSVGYLRERTGLAYLASRCIYGSVIVLRDIGHPVASRAARSGRTSCCPISRHTGTNCWSGPLRPRDYDP